jgi:hypothetical protein
MENVEEWRRKERKPKESKWKAKKGKKWNGENGMEKRKVK